MSRVYVWPDATWVWAEEYEENEMRFLGDDYVEIEVGNATEDKVDRLALEAVSYPTGRSVLP